MYVFGTVLLLLHIHFK